MTELQTHDAPCLFIPRAAWGLTETEADRRRLVVQLDVRPECYVHHQGAGNLVQTTPIGWAQALDRYAVRTKRFKAVDYDAGICRTTESGTVAIVEMRGIYVGGATEDRNNVSQAVVYSGDRSVEGLTGQEIDAFRWLVYAMVRADWLAPDALVLGHRDNPEQSNGTSCPGNGAYAYLPELRQPWAQQPQTPTTPEDDDMADTKYVRRALANAEDDRDPTGQILGRVWHVNFDTATVRTATGAEFYGVKGLNWVNDAAALSDDQLRELGVTL